MKIKFVSLSSIYYQCKHRLNSLNYAHNCQCAGKINPSLVPIIASGTRALFKHGIKLLIPIVFVFLGFAVNILAQTEGSTPGTVKLSSQEVRARDFDTVWKTVNEKHFDPTFGGVDWQKVRTVYEPLAMTAKTDNEFYGILQKMLGELHQSHFSISPPDSEISTGSFSEGEIGIDLRLLNGEAVITRVETNSPAAVAGLNNGFVISKIDGKTVFELLTPLEERLKNRRDTESVKMLYRNETLLYRISGAVGTSVSLDVLDAGNKPRMVEIKRAAYKGEMSQPFGNFPAQQVVFESKILPENIGYIRFNIWVVPQMAKLLEAVKAMKDVKGIIFDLRGNLGGLGVMASGLAGWLVKEKTSLGTMKSRTGEINFSVTPQANAFLGKIVILTDSESASTSEVFAAGLQDLGRAEIVGETSAGAALPSVFEKLPSGALFQYAIADYKSPNKVLLEGRGVKPDVEVKLTRESISQGHDIFVDTAVKEILK